MGHFSILKYDMILFILKIFYTKFLTEYIHLTSMYSEA